MRTAPSKRPRTSSTNASRYHTVSTPQVLFCRDTKAHDVIQIAVIDQHGVRVENPVRINSQWDFRGFVNRANERLHTQ